MTIKVYVNPDAKWWTEQRQMDALAPIVPGWPEVVIYDNIEDVLRPTTRKGEMIVFVASLAVIAGTSAKFLEVFRMFPKEGSIISAETGARYFSGYRQILKAWNAANYKSRIEGAARRGGLATAAKAMVRTKAGIDRIRDRWKLPSKEWATEVLLKEAGVSLNTVKAVLGSRIIAQHNHRAAQKRKAKREARG